MSHIQTFNTQSNGPEILERLSELEARDKSATGRVRTADLSGEPTADPRGFTVLNTTGHDVGKVDDLYVDPNTRQPYFALLNLGNHTLGMGNRSVLVDFDDLEIRGDEKVQVRISLEG